MPIYGLKQPEHPRHTALHEAEEWYQNLLSERLGIAYSPIQRSNFGNYDMAVHYLTSVLEEAKSIEKVSVFNIDHMAQIKFTGKDAAILLDRVLPINIHNIKIGQCKYTLLLNENGTVRDDMIVMRLAEDCFILVINAGHDITITIEGNLTVRLIGEDGNTEHLEAGMKGMISDTDYIMQYKLGHEEVFVEDISEKLVKVDVQGPLAFKVITEVFGDHVLKNRNNPEKNMSFFTFNEIDINGETYIFSRTGYTNRWGWEIYLPINHAVEKFKEIVLKVLEYGGLLVGLGGRDENRISAGYVGLPLMGSEYDAYHTPTNAPLFAATIDWNKNEFFGRDAIQVELERKIDKRLVIIIAEGNITNNGVYLDGKRLGSVTSCIISPNVPWDKRLFIESSRKNVNDEFGNAAIALAWLYKSPYKKDENKKDILFVDDNPVRIRVELFREKDGLPFGKPVLGYISADGVNPETAAKPLKSIL